MRRSITVVAVGRGLTILWVLATALQVMCDEIPEFSSIDDDSKELYEVVSKNKIELVTQMINNKGVSLPTLSKRLNLEPLKMTDINPLSDKEDATAVRTARRRRRQYPRAPEKYHTGTRTAAGPEMQMSRVTDDRPEIVDGKTMATAGDEENGDQRLRSQLEGPRVRRFKPKKVLQDPQPATVNQL